MNPIIEAKIDRRHKSLQLSDFKAGISVLDSAIGMDLRHRYISKFVNTKGEWYQKHILNMRQFSDGLCYVGYLWKCLFPSRKSISGKTFWTKLKQKDELTAFWDINTCERIIVPDYWKFPKDSVIRLPSKLLLQNKWILSTHGYLPEDIYLFDDTLEWSLISTHESDEKGRQLYIEV